MANVWNKCCFSVLGRLVLVEILDEALSDEFLNIRQNINQTKLPSTKYRPDHKTYIFKVSFLTLVSISNDTATTVFFCDNCRGPDTELQAGLFQSKREYE